MYVVQGSRIREPFFCFSGADVWQERAFRRCARMREAEFLLRLVKNLRAASAAFTFRFSATFARALAALWRRRFAGDLQRQKFAAAKISIFKIGRRLGCVLKLPPIRELPLEPVIIGVPFWKVRFGNVVFFGREVRRGFYERAARVRRIGDVGAASHQDYLACPDIREALAPKRAHRNRAVFIQAVFFQNFLGAF